MSGLRQHLASASLAFRFYVLRSLVLDLGTARMGAWPARSRVRFLASKARAILRLVTGRTATVAIGPIRVRVTGLSDLGTVQASLADVHDELVGPGHLATRRRPVVVDVGANMGQFTTAVKAFWPEATILAFEPDPDVHAVLADNARRLGGVTTRAVALGTETARLPLHRHHLSAMSTLRPGLVETYAAGHTVEVLVVRLDDATEHLTTVDLLKVDVEGFEVEVLRGAPRLLQRTRFLLVEVSLGRADASTEPEVVAVVTAARPDARVIGRGRPIGGAQRPICQDILIDLAGATGGGA